MGSGHLFIEGKMRAEVFSWRHVDEWWLRPKVEMRLCAGRRVLNDQMLAVETEMGVISETQLRPGVCRCV